MSRTRVQQLSNMARKIWARILPTPRSSPLPIFTPAILTYMLSYALILYPIYSLPFVKQAKHVFGSLRTLPRTMFLPSDRNPSAPQSCALYTNLYPATNTVHFRAVPDATQPEGQGKGAEGGRFERCCVLYLEDHGWLMSDY